MVALLSIGACGDERARVGSEPTEPFELPDVTGTYEATHLIVNRPNSSTELIGEPNTRLNLQLNADGSARGQLKIATDPELRTKQDLIGTWRLLVPNRVTFDFSHLTTFLEEIAFRIQPDGMVGDWVGETVGIRIELEKVG